MSQKVSVDFEVAAWRARNYRDILTTWIKNQPEHGKNARSKLADGMAIQRDLMSKILSGARDLTIEQGYAAARFMNLSASLIDQFLDLLQAERSGARSSTGQYLIARATKRRNSISKKLHAKQLPDVPEKVVLDEKNKNYFYSEWVPGLICSAVLLPNMNTAEKISKLLKIDLSVLKNHLEKLIQMGFLARGKNPHELLWKGSHGFESDPIFAKNVSTSYRLLALEVRNRSQNSDNWFFSADGVFSKTEVEEISVRLKNVMRDLFQNRKSAVNGEVPDALCVLNLDWFQIS